MLLYTDVTVLTFRDSKFQFREKSSNGLNQLLDLYWYEEMLPTDFWMEQMLVWFWFP